jgi:hypothetical protein
MSEPKQLHEATAELARSFGFQAHYDFKIGDENYRITYKQFLPADMQRGLDTIDISLESCDRDDSGVLKYPLRRGGQALTDSRDALRLRLLWGDEKYERFRDAGGSPDLLSVVWLRMETDLEKHTKS